MTTDHKALPGLLTPEATLHRLADQLATRFTGVFTRETIDRYVFESYTALGRTAKGRLPEPTSPSRCCGPAAPRRTCASAPPRRTSSSARCWRYCSARSRSPTWRAALCSWWARPVQRPPWSELHVPSGTTRGS